MVLFVWEGFIIGFLKKSIYSEGGKNSFLKKIYGVDVMNLDLGNFKPAEAPRKGENIKTIGDNPMISRMDYDQVGINDLNEGELFSGKVQVPRILNKADKSYDTAIVEVFNDNDKEKLTLWVNFDSRKEEIGVNSSFNFYKPFFNLVKALAIANDEKNKDKESFVRVNPLLFFIALDSLDTITIMAKEGENDYMEPFFIIEE